MNHRIKVTLAEDGDALRRSLADSLREQPDISVLGVASEGGKLVALCREMPPDVVVMETDWPEASMTPPSAPDCVISTPRPWVVR